MQKPKYNKNTKHFARNLRTDSTPGEIILWSKVLRNRTMSGYQFNRQYSLEIPPTFEDDKELNIIVDFICRKLKLIIEIDGYSHNFKHEKDEIRDEKLQKFGYVILRFSESETKYDLENVVRTIELKIKELEDNTTDN